MSLYLLVVLVIKEYITFNGVVTLNGVLVKIRDTLDPTLGHYNWYQPFLNFIDDTMI